MKVHAKPSTDKCIVFSNGAVDPNKNKPPVYMRSSWSEDIDASAIFIDDPTLHGTKLRLGWGQGNRDVFHLEEIADILKILLTKINVQNDGAYFFGSSAGGFMSLYYSILMKGSTAVVNNPQTKVLNYLRPYAKSIVRHSYGIDPKGLNIISYFDEQLGHNPIRKNDTVNIINKILNGELALPI